MASNRNNDIGTSNSAELIKSIKHKCKINIDGFLYIKDKIVMVCIIGFANTNHKRKQSVLQKQLQFVLGTSTRFKNFMLNSIIMLQKQVNLKFPTPAYH